MTDTSASAGRRPLLTVDGLGVAFAGVGTVVDDVSFHIGHGEALAIVGESGSGKSVTARTLVGLTGESSRVQARQLAFNGTDLLALRERGWRRIRGSRIGFVLQDALISLDPMRPVGREIAETLKLHTPLTAAERDSRVIELLGLVGVPDPEFRARQLPSELSGGLRQRALIASGIAAEPDLLIADEPTTALDVTVQAQILALLRELKDQGRSLLLISHDLAVVSSIADRVAVMRDGRIVEAGETRTVYETPRDEYTKELLAAVPSEQVKNSRLSVAGRAAVATGRPAAERKPGEVVLRATGLTKSYRGRDGVTRTVVKDVSLYLRAGETLGIVGESGSGKTTTGRLLLGLVPADAGTVEVLGQGWDGSSARQRQLRRQAQLIYQDPLGSFDPRYTVGKVLGEAVALAGIPRTGRRERSLSLLDQVGLPSAVLRRRPIELSGGQRQRVALARALATSPRLIVLDEPVSSLDVSIQAQVLDLLADVQERTKVAYLFISHDLGVVYHVSDRVLVLTGGRVVEEGSAEQVFHRPEHDYTKALIEAIPRLRLADSPIPSQGPRAQDSAAPAGAASS